jgi:imidazole glycerol-phosphate synthase subunit HisF
MLRSRIIPCLLLRDGGLVKTRQFSDPKYVGDPLNAVKIFNEKEVDELMVFDIDCSKKGKEPDYRLLANLASESRMPLCYGGGISSLAQASRIISLGYEKISLCSAALNNSLLIGELAAFLGSQSIVVTIDIRQNLTGGYSIYSHSGSVKQSRSLGEFCLTMEKLGAGELVIQSIDRDGQLTGYNLALAKDIRSRVSIPLTFLGGAGSTSHIQSLIDEIGVTGAAAGSLFVFQGTYRAVLISYSRPGRLF